jgi:hypothetical protein
MGRGETRASTTNNRDALGFSGCATRLAWRQLFAHEQLAVTSFDAPTRHRIEGRRFDRFASAQAEACVMPRASDCVADDQSLG